MATTVQQMPPVAHMPLVLGGLRRLAVATVMARLIPPHPAPGLACGRGVEALGRAMLAGHHALSQGGSRLAARGMVALRQPGGTRAALPEDRVGPSLDALLAANLNGVLRPAAPDLWRQAIAPDRAGLVGLSMGSASGTGTRHCGLIRGCPGERGACGQVRVKSSSTWPLGSRK
jgi:hypothetical protein